MSYYSAIHTPPDADDVQIITGDVSYYISPDGSDSIGDGTSALPWKSLTKAFNHIEDARIANDASVTFIVRGKSGMGDYNTHMIGAIAGSESKITVNHPDAKKITIRGDTSSTLNLFAINYYDSSSRAIKDGSVTGGYLMEITVQDTSNVNVGDFITIKDTNYSATSTYTTGISGATFLETDFAHYRTGGTDEGPMDGAGTTGAPNVDLNGATADYAPLSLRKCLAFGCHEVLGVDSEGGSVSSNTLLLHVRHTNPTYAFLDGIAGGASGGFSADNAYITPQSLRFTVDTSAFPTADIGASIAGYIGGDLYNGSGSSGSRFGPSGGTHLPVASGFTAGATGNFGGWTGGNAYLNTGHFRNLGSTAGGISGGNGWMWDYGPTTTEAKNAFIGIEVKHIPSKIYWETSGGLEFNASEIGKIKDIVLCGPGFAEGATAYLPASGSVGIKAMNGGGLIETDNVGIVGFESGFLSENNSQMNTDGSIVSACRNGFVSDKNSYISSKHTIASGCYDGYKANNQSTMNNSYSISVANENDGVVISDNSSANSSFGLSLLNGGYGYHANNESSIQLTRGTSTSELNTTLADLGIHGVSLDRRYRDSDKSGSFAFRNGLSGVYAENSTVYGSNSRSSYNNNAGYFINRNSHIDGHRMNAYFNGISNDTDHHGSGYSIRTNSSGDLFKCVSMLNRVDGFNVTHQSKCLAGTAEASHNVHCGFRVEYNSTLFANYATAGTGGVLPASGAIENYIGLISGNPVSGVSAAMCNSDSIMYFDESKIFGGTAGATSNGIVRYY